MSNTSQPDLKAFRDYPHWGAANIALQTLGTAGLLKTTDDLRIFIQAIAIQGAHVTAAMSAPIEDDAYMPALAEELEGLSEGIMALALSARQAIRKPAPQPT